MSTKYIVVVCLDSTNIFTILQGILYEENSEEMLSRMARGVVDNQDRVGTWCESRLA